MDIDWITVYVGSNLFCSFVPFLAHRAYNAWTFSTLVPSKIVQFFKIFMSSVFAIRSLTMHNIRAPGLRCAIQAFIILHQVLPLRPSQRWIWDPHSGPWCIMSWSLTYSWVASQKSESSYKRLTVWYKARQIGVRAPQDDQVLPEFQCIIWLTAATVNSRYND